MNENYERCAVQSARWYAVHMASKSIAGKPRGTMTAAEGDCIQLVRAYRTSSDAFQAKFLTESEVREMKLFGISWSCEVAK